MPEPDWTFSDQDREAAIQAVKSLDAWRASGLPVPEVEIIAQAICDSAMRSKPN